MQAASARPSRALHAASYARTPTRSVPSCLTTHQHQHIRALPPLAPLDGTQTGIPDADRFGHHDVVGQVEAGWREQVFGRIRRVFGYGC